MWGDRECGFDNECGVESKLKRLEGGVGKSGEVGCDGNWNGYCSR